MSMISLSQRRGTGTARRNVNVRIFSWLNSKFNMRRIRIGLLLAFIALFSFSTNQLLTGPASPLAFLRLGFSKNRIHLADDVDDDDGDDASHDHNTDAKEKSVRGDNDNDNPKRIDIDIDDHTKAKVKEHEKVKSPNKSGSKSTSKSTNEKPSSTKEHKNSNRRDNENDKPKRIDIDIDIDDHKKEKAKEQKKHKSSNKNRSKSTNENPSSTKEHKNRKSNSNKPLNILLFYADDWSFKTLGVINPFVKTPNIDKMAENGVLFTHNCVTTSICMVSRATLYTGQYASRHQTYQIEDTAMYAKHKWKSTLFPLLAKHGYHNGMVGKWHHTTPPKHQETFAMFRNYWGEHYVEQDDGEEIHVTDLDQKNALEFLNNRPRDKPFALMVSFFATHAEDGSEEQYRPQKRTSELYKNETVPIPKTATEEHFHALPDFLQNPMQIGRERWEERYKTPEMYQHMMKKTYRMATEVDTACGVILEKLKEQGALDDTIVVFTTDNGNFHGEHGLSEKWYPYEESIRVPLVVMDPRTPKSMRNTTNDEFTLSIDLAPTLLQAANIPIPEVMQGRDIAPMYLGSDSHTSIDKVKSSWRKEFYYEWFTGDKVVLPASLALVRKDTKYILWPEYGYEELFRLGADPYEENNLLFNSSLRTSSALLDEMKGRFEELKAAAKDGAKL